MIPILYKAKETDFVHNGVGALAGITACTVTENRNGTFELTFEYPLSGRLYAYIQEDCIVKAKPNDTSKPQLFRIYKSSKPTNGRVTYNAEHISYRLSGIPIETVEFRNANARTAITNVLSAGIAEHGFEAWSDIETPNSTSLSLVSVRAALGGVQGSILDVYGGEFEFDNFTVKLHAHRGRDTGIRVAYGKNLTSFRQEKSISEVYTAVYPYARYTPTAEDGSLGSEITVVLSEKTIASPNANNYAHTRILMKDFTESFELGEEITEERLRTKARSWVDTSGFDVPTVNITVSFKNLWQSPEYARYALLERVSLCDTVTVDFEQLGISAKAKIIKTVYDVLKEQYTSIELGDAKNNFADTVNQSVSSAEDVRQEIKRQSISIDARLSKAIGDATAAITGQTGGCVVLNPPNNPQEILILDKPSIAEAVNVWRWNSAGLGHSKNGYNGPYELAATADGQIVADFITAGTLRGELLEAGSVKASAISGEYKSQVTDEIEDASREVTQAFIAADEQLRSLIQAVTETLVENTNRTETKITELEQTVDGIKSSVTETVREAINDLEIGGRNYFLGTGESQTIVGTNSTNQTAYPYSFAQTYIDHFRSLGSTITISFDYEATSGATGTFRVHTRVGETGGYVYCTPVMAIDVGDNPTGHIVKTYTFSPEDQAKGKPSPYFRLDDFVGSLAVSNMQWELGNVATDWTPAPEDAEIYVNERIETSQTSIIQEAGRITMEALDSYVSQNRLEEFAREIETQLQIQAGNIEMSFSESNRKTIEVDGRLQEFLDEFRTYIRFSADGIDLGKEGSPFASRLGTDRLSFTQNNREIAYISNNTLYITDAYITGALTMGGEKYGKYRTFVDNNKLLVTQYEFAVEE